MSRHPNMLVGMTAFQQSGYSDHAWPAYVPTLQVLSKPAVYMQAVPKRAQREDGSAASPAAEGAAVDSPRPAAEAEAEAIPVVSKRGRQLKQVRSHAL